MTTAEYDNIRKNLVDAMPACPKDLEIQSLKDQLKRAKMHADLKWLAENVSEWGGTYGFKHIFLKDGEAEADYSSEPCGLPKTFTRAQWQAARDELISPFSSPEEDEAWAEAERRMDAIAQNGNDGEHYPPAEQSMPADLEHLARTVLEWNESLDRVCKHTIGVEWFSSEHYPGRHGYSEGELLQARRDLGLVTTEGEDEAFDAIGKRDVFEEIAEGFDDLRAGNFNSFWVKDPSALSDRPYSKYFRDVSRLDSIDVYRVHTLFAIEDCSGCLQHASKKLLLGGSRTGGKTKMQDIEEARDTLTRWLEMEKGR
jgi:hypothetical protein